MSKASPTHVIRLRGVRHNNLKNFDLDLPTGRLIVVTGLSGSGKSSLAFDTLYAEGQRRYIETFSPYARQFLDRMDKPQVDLIQGIPPAIAIEQRNAVKSTRSTVGTMTEICEYMKAVWCHISQLFCRRCQQVVRKDSPQTVWQEVSGHAFPSERDVLVAFEIPLSEKLSLEESLSLISKQGYQRLLLNPRARGEPPWVARMTEALPLLEATARPTSLVVVQDRLKSGVSRARFIEACEQAYHFGKGKLQVHFSDGAPPRHFSNRLHCARCDLEYREPSSALFSFNHPSGACPTCRGFGRTITIDYDLAIPDRSLTLAEGVVKPWQSGQSAECQHDLMTVCRRRKVPVNVPFKDLSPEWQRLVVDGDPDYGRDPQHEWPRAWYGVKGYFRWLESRAYKMHVRVLLSRYRSYRTCPVCEGRRFQPEPLWFKAGVAGGEQITLADFYQSTVQEALRFLRLISPPHAGTERSNPVKLALDEVCSRLAYLEEVGLGYLSLDRPTRSLSGGETERVNLTTCLGSRLVNTLFVLDEPTVGLHARDTQRLVSILRRLRDAGNTVVVVEHERGVMRAADQLVDLGPGQGESGGFLVFQGTYAEMLKSRSSVTGACLRGEKRTEASGKRLVRRGPAAGLAGHAPALRVSNATCHNLRNLGVVIPLERFVCLTGVSGSGKTTLLRDVLLPALKARLEKPRDRTPSELEPEEGDLGLDEAPCAEPDGASVEGWQNVGRVVLVDQAPLGKTPRSNPAVYIGAFEHIREFFAQSEAARQRGLSASAFSFNSSQGQCEHCRGAGFEKIEMQFLSDVYVRCPACEGRRYREHILEVKVPDPAAGVGDRGWSIADLLEATVEQGIALLSSHPANRAAQRAVRQLRLLQDVGLGYLRLGQPVNTLSGGECQRLKLVSHLAEFSAAQDQEAKPTLFLFDEPTTGLHFADVKVLLQVLQRLVDDGHSVLVIEHNLDVIRCADWIIDLGPEGGEQGGQIVATGTAQEIAACPASATGACLRAEFEGAS